MDVYNKAALQCLTNAIRNSDIEIFNRISIDQFVHTHMYVCMYVYIYLQRRSIEITAQIEVSTTICCNFLYFIEYAY